MSLFIIIIKTSFLSSLLISLHREFINKAFYIRTNIYIGGSSFISVFAEIK
jgi:hypothetical protein